MEISLGLLDRIPEPVPSGFGKIQRSIGLLPPQPVFTVRSDRPYLLFKRAVRSLNTDSTNCSSSLTYRKASFSRLSQVS